MKRIFLFNIILIVLLSGGVNFRIAAQKDTPADYVNPFVGTDFFGHTFPGASLPYSMVHHSLERSGDGQWRRYTPDAYNRLKA